MEYKVCSKCGRSLPIDKFYKKNKHSEERRSYCKECGNNWQLKYYDKNRKERVVYQKDYEARKRMKNKKYEIVSDDKKEIKETMKKYYEGGKKTITTVSKKTIRNSQLVKDYKNYFKEQHGGKIFCEACGQWEEVGDLILEVHHKIKVSDYEKEGKEYSTFEDTILLCPTCHSLFHRFGDLDNVKEITKRNLQKIKMI